MGGWIEEVQVRWAKEPHDFSNPRPGKEGIMKRNLLFTLWACGVCCLFGLSAGCSGGNSAMVLLTGRAIQETIGGAVGLPPRDSPLSQNLLIFHAPGSSTEVARTQTDNAGNFTLSLPAGTYRVDLVDRTHPFYDFVTPQDIVVGSGMSTQIEVKFVLQAP
jgi:hypothetical protein